MSTLQINRRFSLVGTLILSAVSLGALLLPLSPAKAQCLGVDLGFGCAGLGVGSWYSRPYYYGYPYYGYPAYSYPTSYSYSTSYSYPSTSYSYPSTSYSYPTYGYPYYSH